MSKRDELIAKYAADLKDKFGVNPDMDLLTKVTIGCGPSIYNADAATISGSDESELATVKNNFLIKKLGLKDKQVAVFGNMPKENDRGILVDSRLPFTFTMSKVKSIHNFVNKLLQ